VKITRTKHGARMSQGGAVLSEVLAKPGPTHSVFDLLAALVHVLAPGPRVGVLGFAGGGIIAPLRAMGGEHRIRAVDSDPRGGRLFFDICGDWAGEVQVDEDDAVDWLQRRRGRFDCILEDLSELGVEGETKPVVSVVRLPELVAQRLDPSGISIVNLLPVPAVAWRRLTPQVIAPFGKALVVFLTEFENRIAIAGERLPRADTLERRTKSALATIGSRMERGFQIKKP
jgi:spermidine synthase